MSLQNLARRAVASKHWRWLKRMADVDGITYLGNSLWAQECGTFTTPADEMGHLLPDLSDPATLGCLLALVREAWGGTQVPEIFSTDEHGGACVMVMSAEDYANSTDVTDHPEYNGTSLAEALVAALEAAP